MFGTTFAEHPAFPSVCNVLLTSMRGLAFCDAFEGRASRHRRHLADWVQMARAMLLAAA